MVILRRSGRKIEAEQQIGAFPLGPLEALGGGRGGRKHPNGAGVGISKSHVSIVCRQVHLHLSTDALRLRTGFQKSEFLSVSVDRRARASEEEEKGWEPEFHPPSSSAASRTSTGLRSS
ncbi:hypothetical protein Taro_046697 [Colocasia esculenta]|uniref:Uncharacterized protein n=1 Tax=Colocasia esculenta TaxID=4460 RepID=A0A843WUE2_COLES|nr:hypothetical protein [Colocasia esculenta]